MLKQIELLQSSIDAAWSVTFIFLMVFQISFGNSAQIIKKILLAIWKLLSFQHTTPYKVEQEKKSYYKTVSGVW